MVDNNTLYISSGQLVVCITTGLSRSQQKNKIKKHLTKTNLLHAAVVMKKQTNKKNC